MEVIHQNKNVSNKSIDLLSQLLKTSREQNSPFLLFRYPNKSILLASHSPEKQTEFLLAPFNDGETITVRNFDLFDENAFEKFKLFPRQSVIDIDVPHLVNQNRFKANIVNAKIEIRNSNFQKVVLSKVKELKEEIHPIKTFYSLEKKYNSAFVYCFFHPNCGLWIGASPEKLLEKDDKETYHIHSLAGTKPTTGQWTQKEKDEQQIVTEYITQKLRSNNVENLMVEGPFDYIFGSIKHLKSSIHFKTTLGSKRLVDIIHPTPAVCGMPFHAAKDFILKEEGYDRSYYTGYIGISGLTDINETYFVNLRCMRTIEDNTYIYTGAGIVEDSDPDEEWKEVEAKAQTLIECISTDVEYDQ